jgi:hypothetical protein
LVVEIDLTQGAAVVGVTAEVIADTKEPFAAHPSSTAVQSMLEKVATLAVYNYLKTIGTLP